MITPSIEISQPDLNRLNKLLTFTAEHTSRNMGSLVKQSAITAIQSAAKATKPGDAASVKSLALKYKLRPLFPIQSVLGGKQMYQMSNGKTFQTENVISKKSQQAKGLKQIKKAFQSWSKKQNRWSFIPYLGEKNGKYDAGAKGGRIPGYGAAKAGWLKALSAFGKPENLDGNLKRPVSKVSAQLTGKNPFALIQNLVAYISKTAPESARIGIEKATNRLEKVLIPKLSKELQDKWRNS